MCIIYGCKSKIAFFVYSIANAFGQMLRKNQPVMLDIAEKKHKHTFDKVFFLYLFAMVLYVVMDVIKNGNFCPLRLLAVYIRVSLRYVTL